MKNIVIASIIALLLSGCVYRSTAHAGKDFDETKATQLVSGRTTDNQLIALLGEPVKKEIVNDHEVKWIYEYVTSTAAVKVFNPNPKVDVSKKALEVLLRDGVVVNHALTNPGTTQYR